MTSPTWPKPGSLRYASRTCLRVALALAGMFVTLNPLSAQIGMRIKDPVPVDLRDRVTDLLRVMRPIDADAAFSSARIIDGDLWRKYDLLFLRVEADCRDDLCMTVLARIKQDVLTPELILNADNQVDFTDASVEFWGASDFPFHIKGRDNTGIRVTPRYGSWVVEACGGCFPSAEELARRLQEPPTPPSPIPTFEEFSGALNLFR